MDTLFFHHVGMNRDLLEDHGVIALQIWTTLIPMPGSFKTPRPQLNPFPLLI